MGGKSKLLDTHKLESLYQESRQYENLVMARMQTIQKEMAKLSELSIQQSRSGTGGPALRAAVSKVSNAMETLKENFDQTKRFIDGKLAGAVNPGPLRKESHDQVRSAGNLGSFPMDPRLKR